MDLYPADILSFTLIHLESFDLSLLVVHFWMECFITSMLHFEAAEGFTQENFIGSRIVDLQQVPGDICKTKTKSNNS